MPRYSKKPKVSEQTRDEAMKIARGTQKPGQTKEQTKLIAQGIQKGIDLYKKQQKTKSRELDRKLRKVSARGTEDEHNPPVTSSAGNPKPALLPWILLIVSWIGFALYIILQNYPPS